VFYENDIILRGYNDPTTDLWTLPIIHDKVAKTIPESVLVCPHSTHMTLSHHVEHAKVPIRHAMVLKQPSPWVHDDCATKTIQPQPSPCVDCAQCKPMVKTAGFFYAEPPR